MPAGYVYIKSILNIIVHKSEIRTASVTAGIHFGTLAFNVIIHLIAKIIGYTFIYKFRPCSWV